DSVTAALVRVSTAYATVSNVSEPGLAEALEAMHKDVLAEQATVKSEKNRANRSETLCKTQASDADTRIDELEAKIEDQSRQIRAERATNAKQQKQREADLAQAEGRLRSTQKRLQGEIDSRDEQINSFVVSLQAEKKMVDSLKHKVSVLAKANQPVEQEVKNPPDGQVFAVEEDDAICYINLGTNKGMQTGMTFTVYRQGGSTQKDKKGMLRVIKVTPSASECRIVELISKDEPIREKDTIANFAYSATRAFTFVVVGKFDLSGAGIPSDAGRQEVTRAIKRYGSKVGSAFDFQTDYVVMGARPDKPTEPGDGASKTSQRAYQIALADWKAFSAIEKKARDAKIPILNQNRFMDLTGYVPDKAAE
ncbi:MAG: hypothetical protein HN909_05495, partial [Phycisphaerales bacterium]|nr:hypothetical protein [Phycisphaerales bacterium]